MNRANVSNEAQPHPERRRPSDRTQGEHQYVGDVLREANRTANWGQVRGLYEQYRHIRRSAPTHPLPSDSRDALAKCLSDLAASYEGDEERFLRHARAVLAEVDGYEAFDVELFVGMYGDRVSRDGLPAVFETVAETSRRQRDARIFAQALADADSSVGMGGSMGFAPFFGVHGPHRGKPASDLDLIIVMDDAVQLREIIGRLRGLAGVDAMSLERLQTRADIFLDRIDDGATVLSHKVTLWADKTDDVLAGTELPGNYQMSLHFLTRRTLGYGLVENSPTLTRADAGHKRTIRDYRETRIQRADLLRSFARREHRVRPRMEAVEGGWLRWMTGYLFDETDSYCPGFLQTLLLPEPNLLWDGLNVRRDLVTFQRKFYDRYRHERGRNPDGRLLLPSLAHVRRELFAPYVRRRFDLDG